MDHWYRADPGEEPAHRTAVAAVSAGADPDAGRRVPGASQRQDVLSVPPDIRCGSDWLTSHVEQVDDLSDELVDIGAGAVGRFVRGVDTGETLELTCARPRVQPLGVAPFALFAGRGHVDLDERQLG